MRLFNSAYFHKAPRHATFLQAAWDYFWPLDKIEHWNRIYGRRGLLQYQFVVLPHAAREAVSEVLRLLQQEGQDPSSRHQDRGYAPLPGTPPARLG